MIVCQIHVGFVDFFPSICKTITAFVKKTAQKGNIFDFGAKNCIFNLTFFFKHSQSEVAGLLVSVAAAAARLVVAAVARQKRAGVSAEEGFAQVCSRQSQAETTLRKEKGKAGRSKRSG